MKQLDNHDKGQLIEGILVVLLFIGIVILVIDMTDLFKQEEKILKNKLPPIVQDTIKEDSLVTPLDSNTTLITKKKEEIVVSPKKKEVQPKSLTNPKPKTTPQPKKVLASFDLVRQDLSRVGSSARVIKYKGVEYDVFTVDLRSAALHFHWKNELGQPFSSLGSLKKSIEAKGKKVLFATNGGIFSQSSTPEGLFVENSQEITPLNLRKGSGNFYLSPNGVFLITNKNEAAIVKSAEYPKLLNTLKNKNRQVAYAVQSGPLLRMNGKKHPAFNKGSTNKYIRSGVGIFNKNTKRVVFAISRKPVNLFDFSSLFLDEFKCNDALYLDGAISKMYSKTNKDLGGRFVTMITAVKK